MAKDTITKEREAFEAGWKTNSIQPHTPALEKSMQSDWMHYLVYRDRYYDKCVKSEAAEAHDDLYA